MTVNVLWLARTFPYPLKAGDRLYTARLLEALADAGAQVTVLGFQEDAPPKIKNVDWKPVAGQPSNAIAALFSVLPLVAARHMTREFKIAVRKEVAHVGSYDAVIIDQYGMGWALNYLPTEYETNRPQIIFITHDHEESVNESLWRNTFNSPLRKIFLRLNALKTTVLERKIVSRSNVVTTITKTDEDLFRVRSGASMTLVLSPGYTGNSVPERSISSEVPRTVILFGGFKWSAKQENLRLFLEAADAVFVHKGISIEVVGEVPSGFASEILSKYECVKIIGFVDDPQPYFMHSRLGIIAEPIGGGFKMKLLDYIFNRVPILSLNECATGLPLDVRQYIVTEPNMSALVKRATTLIEDFESLNAAQNGAFSSAASHFNWAERGRALLQVINARSGPVRQDENHGEADFPLIAR